MREGVVVVFEVVTFRAFKSHLGVGPKAPTSQSIAESFISQGDVSISTGFRHCPSAQTQSGVKHFSALSSVSSGALKLKCFFRICQHFHRISRNYPGHCPGAAATCWYIRDCLHNAVLVNSSLYHRKRRGLRRDILRPHVQWHRP